MSQKMHKYFPLIYNRIKLHMLVYLIKKAMQRGVLLILIKTFVLI